jgi:hypothetical protein
MSDRFTFRPKPAGGTMDNKRRRPMSESARTSTDASVRREAAASDRDRLADLCWAMVDEDSEVRFVAARVRRSKP